MTRSGTYVNQPSGHKAFIPKPLPPKPPVALEGDLQNLLSKADMSLARLDGIGHVLPNVNLLIAMYVRKEALLRRLRTLAIQHVTPGGCPSPPVKQFIASA